MMLDALTAPPTLRVKNTLGEYFTGIDSLTGRPFPNPVATALAITNEERELAVACVFAAIGHDPNTKAYQGKLDTDPDSYLIARNLVESKHPGVFIAGDVADRVYKQAVTAAGSGCAAAMEAEKYLGELESRG